MAIKLAAHEEIGPRLQAMGLDPARDIDAVILTHLHHDHTGGLDHFPHTRILAPRENWEASRGCRGMMMGCLPQRWPIWLRPELVDMDGPAVGPFPASYPIAKDGRVFLVPTPGHAKGHVSVVVRDEGATCFLAGDATYSEANLRAERTDGVTNDPECSRATIKFGKSARHESHFWLAVLVVLASSVGHLSAAEKIIARFEGSGTANTRPVHVGSGWMYLEAEAVLALTRQWSCSR